MRWSEDFASLVAGAAAPQLHGRRRGGVIGTLQEGGEDLHHVVRPEKRSEEDLIAKGEPKAL